MNPTITLSELIGSTILPENDENDDADTEKPENQTRNEGKNMTTRNKTDPKNPPPRTPESSQIPLTSQRNEDIPMFLKSLPETTPGPRFRTDFGPILDHFEVDFRVSF